MPNKSLRPTIRSKSNSLTSISAGPVTPGSIPSVSAITASTFSCSVLLEAIVCSTLSTIPRFDSFQRPDFEAAIRSATRRSIPKRFNRACTRSGESACRRFPARMSRTPSSRVVCRSANRCSVSLSRVVSISIVPPSAQDMCFAVVGRYQHTAPL